MKRIILLIVAATLAIAGMQAQHADDARAMRQQVEALKQRLGNTERDNRLLRDEIATLRQEQAQRNRSLEARIDSMERAATATDSVMAAQALQAQRDNQAVNNRLESTWLRAILAIALLALLLLMVTWLINRRVKRGIATIGQIRDKQDKLSEESMKLDTQLLQLIEKQLAQPQILTAAPALATPAGDDHSFTLKVADEIARIEMNLRRMDPDTRGLKQLSKAVERIRDNFLSRGYEIVELLGKPYSDGFKGSVAFEDDESLPEGTRVITRIIKPQVNYNGVMIQAAQITVSQNV